MLLSPAERPSGEPRLVLLDDLPPASDLISPEPTPEFIRSVADYGVLEPVLLRRRAGGYEVLAGRRRIKAARVCGIVSIPALVYDTADDVSAIISIVENEQRSHNFLAALPAILSMLKIGMSKRQISAATGIAAGRLDRILRLQALRPHLYTALVAGDMAMSTAEAAVKLPAAVQDRIKPDDMGRYTMPAVRQAMTAARDKAVSELAALFADEPAPELSASEARLASRLAQADASLASLSQAQIRALAGILPDTWVAAED